MCGICGVWNFDSSQPADAAALRHMAAAIAHRGPDEEGYHIAGSVGLAFRRLSIIDVGGSHQPMTNEDSSAWIVFNGEIYNFQELRAGLLPRHQFRTAGDTETLLHCFEECGRDCVQRLRGMFAFAIWNQRSRQLTLAVDRFGKKPLYYALNSERIVFASELKALLLYPGVRRELDSDAVVEYLGTGFIRAPRAIFRGIRKLPPGHTLTVTPSGKTDLQQYWQPQLRLPAEYDRRPAAALAAELRTRLTEAVRLRMISDVPLGAFLSGGLDSSAIVALMSQLSPRPVRTFSIGFDEAGYDESAYAALVARHCRTEHTHEVVRPDVVTMLPKLARQFDEPFADNSTLPTFLVSEIARRHVTVALSGDGGDEVFAGYTWYRRAFRHVALQQWLPRSLRPGLTAAAKWLPDTVKIALYLRALGDSPTVWSLNAEFFGTTGREALLRPEFKATVTPKASPEEWRRAALDEVAALPWLSQLQHLDLTSYLPGDILVKVDRASMFTSLEVRSPLLDHEIFEFMAGIPIELKLTARESKVLLKRAVADLLPAAILGRRKRGFDLPMGLWLRGPLQPMLRELLLSPNARSAETLDATEVARLVAAHQAGQADHSWRLWALLCLELWMREYLPAAPHG